MNAIAAFFAGAAAGAAAVLLTTPKPGRAYQQELRERAEDLVQQGRQVMAERTAVFSEAIEAGRDAMQREREARLAGIS